MMVLPTARSPAIRPNCAFSSCMRLQQLAISLPPVAPKGWPRERDPPLVLELQINPSHWNGKSQTFPAPFLGFHVTDVGKDLGGKCFMDFQNLNIGKSDARFFQCTRGRKSRPQQQFFPWIGACLGVCPDKCLRFLSQRFRF